MTEAQHTLGPWQCRIVPDEYGGPAFYVMSHSHTGIACHEKWEIDPEKSETDDDGYIQPSENTDISPHRIATARLIASAPDLLEALELITEQYLQICEDNHVMGWPGCVRHVRAIIAKARGEQL
jgi:hypothetical protein